MLQIQEEQGAVLVNVKIVPAASKSRYLGEWEGRARIAVAAQAQRGKANDELVAFVSKKLGIPKRCVSIVRGQTSPQKTVRIDGVTVASVRAAFSEGQ